MAAASGPFRLLGVSPLDYFTWFAHTHVGYAQLRTAELPPVGSEPPQAPLPWETDLLGNPFDQRRGVRAATRHEIGLPLSLGPLRVVPFALGELAYWGEDRDAVEVQRAYGQVGVRGSLPFWSVNPGVQSLLWNVNGIAHKVTLDAEFFWAGANEEFRVWPCTIRWTTMPRNISSGASSTISTAASCPGIRPPLLRAAQRNAALGHLAHHRDRRRPDRAADRAPPALADQTRRARQRTHHRLDRASTWKARSFPMPTATISAKRSGLLNYDFRWHVGDRLTLLSDGFADLFPDGLRTFSWAG
jgi:hypothetical protein